MCMWPCCIVTNFFIVKPSTWTNFPNLLWHETLNVSGSSSAHHQEFIHCTLSTGICHRSCSKAVFKPVWHIPVPSVFWINSWWWTEELPETCKVSYRSKFGKLVHLVGFIIKKKLMGLFALIIYWLCISQFYLSPSVAFVFFIIFSYVHFSELYLE